MVSHKTRVRSESRCLDAAARAGVPGAFLTLPDGMTYYELAGPTGGQLAVLIHGFSVPCYTWDAAFAALSQAGVRVLRYDLYGRGYSDRPAVNNGPDLFDRQLAHLLAGLDITGPVDLVGLSMGGAIAVTFADRHLDQVRRLVLVGPAGWPIKSPASARLLDIPWLGECLLATVGDRALVASLADDFFHPERFPEYQARYRDQMQYRGFKRALLSTLRSGFIDNLAETYRRIGQHPRPVLLIWGQEDRVIPFALSSPMRAALPRAEFHPIERAGHVAHYERPEVVNPLLLEFLRRE